MRDGLFGIDAINADGTGRRKLVPTGSGDVTVPSWSPDGTWVAFNLVTRDGLEIGVVRSDGQGLRRLTRNDWLDAAASWQPTLPLRT